MGFGWLRSLQRVCYLTGCAFDILAGFIPNEISAIHIYIYSAGDVGMCKSSGAPKTVAFLLALSF